MLLKKFFQLLKSEDAVYISPGLLVPYRLGVEGEDHPAVLSGLDVLADVTNGKTPKLGKKVAVIGGGNVAMDAARTARRLGAEVTILYRRREVDMPADQEEIDDARKEKINLVTQAIPVRIESKGKNKVIMVWGKARMVDQGPGKRPVPELMEDKIEKSEFDTIISAVGQGPQLDFIDEKSGIKIERYKLKTKRFSPAATWSIRSKTRSARLPTATTPHWQSTVFCPAVPAGRKERNNGTYKLYGNCGFRNRQGKGSRAVLCGAAEGG